LLSLLLLLFMLTLPPSSTLFPYTTLFRSNFVNVVVVPELRDLLGEPHHQFTAAPKQARIQKLHVGVLPHELLKLAVRVVLQHPRDRKSTRLNSSHVKISYAVFCLKKKKRT